MGNKRTSMRGGIRQKIIRLMLVTMILIITAYTAVFFFQTRRVERLVNDTYEAQMQVYAENGLEDQFETMRTGAVESFHSEMFHARNILILPVKVLTKATSDLVENIDKGAAYVSNIHTGDEIEALSESFEKMDEELKEYISLNEEITAEKKRIEAELDMASSIQASQLPRLFPPFPNRDEFTLYASMTPAKEVGGDFYDFFMIDPDHIALVMADVSGKGVPAALMMMMARVLIKSSLQNGKSPEEALESVNNQLCEDNDAGFFITVWVGVLEISTGKGLAVNAGHEHPVLRRAGGSYELVEYRHAMPIATLSGLRFKQHEFRLYPGDSLFVYTDGVAEATNADNELFGCDRMLDALNRDADAEPRQILENVMQDINRFVDEAEQFDDITMLCFRYLGSPDASP